MNYSLSGKRLDIQLRGKVLPGYETSWEKVLISIEDVTDREEARRQHAASQRYAEGLFEHSPVSLWVEDFSKIKKLLDGLRNRPERPAELPGGGVAASTCADATGAGLSRPDAGFLVRFAALAAGVRADLAACEAREAAIRGRVTEAQR